MTGIILTTLPLLASLVLAWIALRGRRVGDHAHCRSCRYDLFGLSQFSTRCPECGSDLQATRATIVGLRHRRKGLALSSLLSTLICAVLLCHFAADWWAHFDPTPWKPLFVLSNDVKGPDWLKASKARDEIVQRMRTGKISSARADGLVKDWSAWVAVPGHTFEGSIRGLDPVSSEYAAFLAAGVPVNTLQTFYERAVWVQCDAPQKISQGNSLCFQLSFSADNLVDRNFDVSKINCRFTESNGNAVDLLPADEIRNVYRGKSLKLYMAGNSVGFWKKHGPYVLDGNLTVEAEFFERRGHYINGVEIPDVQRLKRVFPVHVPVISAHTPPISMVTDPATDAAMKTAFAANPLETIDGQIYDLYGGELVINIQNPPENGVFSMQVRQGEKVWQQGTLIVEKGRVSSDAIMLRISAQDDRKRPTLGFAPPSFMFGGGLRSVDPTPSDVDLEIPFELLLISDPDAAAQITPFAQVWKGEIHIPLTLHKLF